jgi:hypothetical protein
MVSRWQRPKMMMRSRHSRRSVPPTIPLNAFASGALIGVRMTSVPSDRNTSSKPAADFASRSRRGNETKESQPGNEVPRLLGHPAPIGVGRVTPAKCTRRDSTSMKNKMKRRLRNTASTVTKSQARMPEA